MIASKVSFSKETIAKLNERPLDRWAKGKVRAQRVQEYIRSKPAGALIPMDDLIAAAGYFGGVKQRNTGYQFIYNLSKRGGE